MKKILLFIIAVSCFYARAQLNPVNNLQYQQTYDFMNSWCPSYNCFSLQWNVPDSSSDTLKGYNVYRHDVFYQFTSGTDMSCPGYMPCQYTDFYDYPAIPYWIKVKAVYNSDSSESVADDSVEVVGIAIGIAENVERHFLTLYPNPFSDMTILNTDIVFNDATLTLYNSYGQIVQQIINISGPSITLHRNDLPCGVYYMQIEQGNSICSIIKLLIVDL